MTEARGPRLLLATILLVSCGGSAGSPAEPGAIDDTTTERHVDYPVTDPGPPTICGWLTMPNGRLDYVPCPSDAPSSPVSDPPLEDRHDVPLPGAPDPRPAPPGDPPPF